MSEERQGMTPQETRAENSRMEQELRQAHEQIERLRSELASAEKKNQQAHENSRSEPAKGLNGEPVSSSRDAEEIDIDIPGVLRIHLRGRAALRFAGLEVPRCEDQGDGG